MNAVQKQLEKMTCFMGDTPDPREHYDESWWAGNVPFGLAPQDYSPEFVEDDGDKPIAVVWYEYILGLQKEARRLESPAMKAHLEAARDLPIADLIAVSREHANDYWRTVIKGWDTQYTWLLEGDPSFEAIEARRNGKGRIDYERDIEELMHYAKSLKNRVEDEIETYPKMQAYPLDMAIEQLNRVINDIAGVEHYIAQYNEDMGL